MNDAVKGSAQGCCQCGRNVVQLLGPAKWVAHCHCLNCQHAHGAAMVTWAGYADGTYAIDDSNTDWYASSAEAQRGRCKHCGSPMYFRSTRWPGELHIARVFLNDNSIVPPQAHVFCHSTPAWMANQNDIPHFEQLPSKKA